MSNYALTQTIVTGSDPRALPEFSAIREEINKANHPSQPELNWKLVESLALSIFKANGVDLHTATYYTLARTRNQGLAGFCEGAELLAAMIIHEWDKFWPQSGPARTEMLDWFNTRTGNILRQQVSFSENDFSLLYRTERALQLICDKLQQVELKRQPRVENLLYFVQNTRKRFEPQPRNRTDTAAQTMVRTLVYAPEGTASATAETMPPLPDLPEMRVGVRGVADNADKAKQGDTVKGFVAGAACTAVIASALWWWQAYPMQQQLTQVRDTTQGAATVWLASPVLKEYEQYLQQLLNAPPLQPLETGMQMMRTADTLWAGKPATAGSQQDVEQHAEKPGASQSADEGLATSAAEFAGFCRFDDEEGDGETGFHPIVYQNGDLAGRTVTESRNTTGVPADAVPGDPYTEAGHTGVGKRDQRTAGRAVKPLAAAEKYRTGYGNG